MPAGFQAFGSAAGYLGGTSSVPDTIFGALLIQWLRSDLGVTTVTGALSLLEDQSPNGNHVGQVSATLRPAYNATDAAFNGHPSIQFDGSNDYLSSSAFNVGACTVFMVSTGLASGTTYFWMRGADVDHLWGTVTYSSRFGARGGAGTSVKDVSADWGVFGATAKSVRIENTGVASGHKLFINNGANELTLSGDSTGTNNDLSALYIGANDSGTSNGAFKLAEFIVVSGVDAAKNQQCETYLRARYGLY